MLEQNLSNRVINGYSIFVRWLLFFIYYLSKLDYNHLPDYKFVFAKPIGLRRMSIVSEFYESLLQPIK